MESKALIYSGITVDVTLRTGEAAKVKLRLIKISEIPKFLDVVLEEARSLAFCLESPSFPEVSVEVGVDDLGKPITAMAINPAAMSYFDTLSDESYIELVDKNTQLNFTRALGMSNQRLTRAEANGSGLAQLVGGLASLLSRYSQKSVSPGATPSASSAK